MIMHQNRSLQFWSENFDRHTNHYSIESFGHNHGGSRRNPHSLEPRSPEEEERMRQRRIESTKRINRQRLIQLIAGLSHAEELILAAGDLISPLVATALGNMAEQAASTLKLLERDQEK